MANSIADPFAGDFEPRVLAALYPLEMEGSREAPEGLLSWVVGLAQAHCVGPRVLLRHLLSNSPKYRSLWGVATFFDRDSGTINGHGRYAQMMVELIGAGQPANAGQMTLLSLSKLFPWNGEGLLARKPKWCHVCLCEQARQGRRLHFPLVWSLEHYRVCHSHHVPLSDQCPACGNTQPFLPSYPSLVHCNQCGESTLAQLPDGFRLEETEVTGFAIWCAQALADLVSRLPVLQTDGCMQAFRSNVELICSVLAHGGRKRFCREIGLQPFALNGWLNKGERPSMSVLLRLCYGIKVMPAAMFMPEPIALADYSPPSQHVGSQRKSRPMLGHKERERIKNLLDVIIADKSDARRLVDIAGQAGIEPTALKYWFWDECRELVLKRRAAEDRRMLLKYRKDHEVLRSVVQNLRAQKINLSRWQVEPELRKHHVTLIRPDLFKALEWLRLS